MGWIRGEILGRGGFAFVSKAKTIHQESNHLLPPIIAVKSAKVSESKPLLKEKELLDQFKACPCILRCFGDDLTIEDGEQLYNILLEYASGGCLADRIITNKGLPEHAVKHYAKSMLIALNHIHKMGYVHCDVKPHNVLIVREGNSQDEVAKLADFGSAKRLCHEQQEDEDDGFRGTVLYAAPESISRQEYVPESDVWALGCTVLHMLTGKAPWKFDKKAQAKDVLLKIGCSNEIPEIPSNKKISEEAKDFLRKCLVKDSRARWRVDMLLDHPFLKMASPENCGTHRHHRLSSRFHSMMPRCFHVRSSAVVHAC